MYIPWASTHIIIYTAIHYPLIYVFKRLHVCASLNWLHPPVKSTLAQMLWSGDCHIGHGNKGTLLQLATWAFLSHPLPLESASAPDKYNETNNGTYRPAWLPLGELCGQRFISPIWYQLSLGPPGWSNRKVAQRHIDWCPSSGELGIEPALVTSSFCLFDAGAKLWQEDSGEVNGSGN